jgi:hypothetical protein
MSSSIRTCWLLACLALPLAAGCGATDRLFGAIHGELLCGYDVLALPNEKVEVRVRLLAGSFLSDQKNRSIRFLRDGKVVKEARTDDEGYASLAFQPASRGNSVFQAEAPPANPLGTPSRADILVACREAADPMCVVDLDKTLVDSGFKQVLIGDPPPMPGSPEVMARLARQFTIVYLTHRPEQLEPKSRAWLRAKTFPEGPLLCSTTRQFVHGSEKYKSNVLTELTGRFHAMRFGVGDKESDAEAYHASGLRTVLLVTPEADSKHLREQADGLSALPADTDAVTTWAQAEKVILGGARSPAAAMQQALRERADRLDPHKAK